MVGYNVVSVRILFSILMIHNKFLRRIKTYVQQNVNCPQRKANFSHKTLDSRNVKKTKKKNTCVCSDIDIVVSLNLLLLKSQGDDGN